MNISKHSKDIQELLGQIRTGSDLHHGMVHVTTFDLSVLQKLATLVGAGNIDVWVEGSHEPDPYMVLCFETEVAS